jgi:hypothetical protein
MPFSFSKPDKAKSREFKRASDDPSELETPSLSSTWIGDQAYGYYFTIFFHIPALSRNPSIRFTGMQA